LCLRFRDRVVATLTELADVDPIHQAIFLYSTRVERLGVLVVFALFLLLLLRLSRLLREAFRPLFLAACAGLAAAAAYTLTGGGDRAFRTALVAAVVLVNGISADQLRAIRSVAPLRWASNALFVLGVGLAEVLLFKPFFLWCGFQLRRLGWSIRVPRALAAVPLLLSAPAVFAFQVHGAWLMKVGERLRADPSVRAVVGTNYSLISDVDLTWMAVDQEERSLLVCGNAVNRFLRYDLADLDAPPQRSGFATGYAQFAAHDPVHRELFVFNRYKDKLVRARTDLEFVRATPFELATWMETFLAWNPATDRVVVALEKDVAEGAPGFVVERTRREILAELEVEAFAHLVSHPSEPWVYFNCHKAGEIRKYDVRELCWSTTGPGDAYMDKMIVDARRGELLATLPVHSEIRRYDAATLEVKGAIRGDFGVRTLAIDEERDLLLAGSLLSGGLDVIDLATHERLARYHLGPWLREIALDRDAALAYVSSRFGIYEVSYTDRLPEPAD
jgi:hypothetical protein